MWNDNEKGQRRPDIFEIATAYENGNGGIIKPKSKDGIYGTYQTLSDDEKKFIFLPNVDYKKAIEFNLDVIERGVYVNNFGDCFRFDTDECEWFGLLSQIKLAI